MTELKVLTAIDWENEEFLVIEIQGYNTSTKTMFRMNCSQPKTECSRTNKAGQLPGDTGILWYTTLASVLPDSLAEHFSGLH